MTRIFAAGNLAATHLVLSALVLVWDLAMAGRIARTRDTTRAMGAMSAVAGLVIAPALFVLIASGSMSTGRSLHTIAWLWPAATLLITAQSVYAAARRLVSPPIGVPIAAYNFALAIVAIVRYAVVTGEDIPPTLVWLSTADLNALDMVGATRALLDPLYVHVPMLAPISPGRRGAGTALRSAAAALAAVWLASIVIAVPTAVLAAASYERYADDRLQERPAGDFTVGVKVLPTLVRMPRPLSLSNDLALADSMGARVLSVYLAPSAATPLALDSLRNSLEEARRNALLIAAVDMSHGSARSRSRDASADELRDLVAGVERIARRLRPAYVVPLVEPPSTTSRSLGMISLEALKGYLRDAALAAHRVDSSTKVMAHVSGISARDSALFAWATRAGSPVDAVGVSLYPWYRGASALDARMAVVDRWMLVERPQKEVWVLEAAGLPLAHGEQSQARALWGALAWATSRAAVKGLVVFEASDYGAPLGLRAPGGRVRQAAAAAQQAVRSLRENVRTESAQ